MKCLSSSNIRRSWINRLNNTSTARSIRTRAGSTRFGSICNAARTCCPASPAVAFADGLPPNTAGQHNDFDLEQDPTGPGESQPVTPWLAVTPEDAGTLGLTLIEGRLLDERDPERNQAAEGLLSVMVDRAWAERLFPNESTVGKRFRQGGCTACPWTTVVGVVSDVKCDGIAQPINGTVYFSLAGSPARFLSVRTQGGDPSPLRRLCSRRCASWTGRRHCRMWPP
jgi:hypothetical protein